jgi:hypothetical protein
MSWQVPRIWEGGDVWILGGGPSVTEQFCIPNKVVQQVIEQHSSPSVYSPYMSYLHDKHVIGVNVAYHIGTWMDMIVFGDEGFYLRECIGLAKYPGIKISCHPTSRHEPWIKYMDRDTSHPKGISPNPKKVSWNHNSGAVAINVAAHAGAKRIFLLGFDMKVGNNKMQHWHDVYKRGPVNPTDQKRLRSMPFDQHLSGFPVIARDAKKLGIQIINVCPDSAITDFPRVSLKELGIV